MRTTIYRVIILTVILFTTTCFAVAGTNPATTKFAEENTVFALNLYSKLKETKGNLFFSPSSISTALAMTYAGARGETAEQMRQTMRFKLPDKQLHSAFAALNNALNNQQANGCKLSVANSLWGQDGYKFLTPFLETTEKYYGAGLRRTDFAGETEQARQTINAWVKEETHNKIKDLISRGVLTPLTRLVLCNAIYFKGDWVEQFDKKLTTELPFHRGDGNDDKVATMKKKFKCLYGENEDLQTISLSYNGGGLSMLILLPRNRDGLSRLESELSSGKLRQLSSLLRKREVTVLLPRFKMSSSFSLSDTLAAMGMPDAFSTNADFSGMNGKHDLHISAVLHKAFVEVNEEGTEAAAATAVVVALRSMPKPPCVFHADHPFVFFIRDNHTGTILFMGRVVNP